MSIIESLKAQLKTLEAQRREHEKAANAIRRNEVKIRKALTCVVSLPPALGLVSAIAAGRFSGNPRGADSSVPSSMTFALDRKRTAGREPCRWSDAGFSRMSNWVRWCIGLLLQSQLKGLSFLCWFLIVGVFAYKPGLELFVLVVDEFKGFSHHVGRRGSRNSAYFVSFILASSSRRNWTTVVLGCLGGVFSTAIGIYSFQI